jgi:hypothetical protein
VHLAYLDQRFEKGPSGPPRLLLLRIVSRGHPETLISSEWFQSSSVIGTSCHGASLARGCHPAHLFSVLPVWARYRVHPTLFFLNDNQTCAALIVSDRSQARRRCRNLHSMMGKSGLACRSSGRSAPFRFECRDKVSNASSKDTDVPRYVPLGPSLVTSKELCFRISTSFQIHDNDLLIWRQI